MSKIQENKGIGYYYIYVPKSIEHELNLKPGDEVEVNLTLIRRALPKKKEA